MHSYFFIYLYVNIIFLIIRNLQHIPSLGNCDLLTILQNDYTKEIFDINSSFPFYYYGSIQSTLITFKAEAPSVQDKRHIRFPFGTPCAASDQEKLLAQPNLQSRRSRGMPGRGEPQSRGSLKVDGQRGQSLLVPTTFIMVSLSFYNLPTPMFSPGEGHGLGRICSFFNTTWTLKKLILLLIIIKHYPSSYNKNVPYMSPPNDSIKTCACGCSGPCLVTSKDP